MTRFARGRRVIFWEEPIVEPDVHAARLAVRTCHDSGVIIVTPTIPEGVGAAEREAVLRDLLDELLATHQGDLLRWYYTPMMLNFSRHLEAVCTVYDCMDELANCKSAPPELAGLERELLALADVVFTGGYSLWEAKRERHPNIHPFPSSVDRAHFARARLQSAQPADQEGIAGPRLGFYGVVDERMDLDLLAALADARPGWSLVIVGPVVKIDPATLPRRPNLHYLGGKGYDELPGYLSGWDVALMPFAINESTRLISPTKTPEYLAAGRPVVSTPIVDVARHYGDLEAVRVAASHAEFVAACDQALTLARGGGRWLKEVDAVLSVQSWDETFTRMNHEISLAAVRREQAAVEARAAQRPASRNQPFDDLAVGATPAGGLGSLGVRQIAHRQAAGAHQHRRPMLH